MDERTLADMARVLWRDPAGFTPDDLPEGVRDIALSERNSPEALGARMRQYLESLLASPSPLLPDYSDRYRLLLTACDRVSPVAAIAMKMLLGKDGSDGFAPIPPARTADLRFPRDHEVKYDFQVGWYFMVGSFRGRMPSGAEREFGIEFCIYDYSVVPPEMARAQGVTGLENTIVELQCAISSDGEDGEHLVFPSVAVAGTSGLVEYGNAPFLARVGEQRLESLGDGDLFPLRLRLRDVETDTQVDLRFASGKTILLQGRNGTDPSIAGLGSLYYSIPAIHMDAGDSTFMFRGEQVELIDSDLFWFDHQWTTGMIPPGAPRSRILGVLTAAKSLTRRERPPGVGWDWFEVQFDDDHQFTGACAHADATLINRTDEDPPAPSTSRLAGARICMPDGSTVDVTGTMTITRWHRSPHTGVWYPDGYEFRLKGAPSGLSHFTCTPINDTGQIVVIATGSEYREGPAIATDAATGREIGRAYCEGVGYIDGTDFLLAAAGLGAGEAEVAVATDETVSRRAAVAGAGITGAAILIPALALTWLGRRFMR